MAKTREQKNTIIENLKEKFGKTKVAVFANYFGLKVKEIQELKKLLKKEKGEFLVTKKTLAKIALDKTDLNKIDFKSMKGGLSISFSYEDEITPIKILTKFTKGHPALVIQGGILEGEFVTPERLKELSTLPTKLELIINLLYQIKSPVNCFVNVLQNNLRGLICVLDNYQEKINK